MLEGVDKLTLPPKLRNENTVGISTQSELMALQKREYYPADA